MDISKSLLAKGSDLVEQVDELISLEDASEWKATAKDLRDEIKQEIKRYKNDLAQFDAEIELAEAARRSKPIYSRVLKSKEEKRISESKDKVQFIISQLKGFSDSLGDIMKYIPSDSKEKKAILKGLRLKKKELNAEKHEVNAQMREIRTKARQKTANVSTGFVGAVGGSKYRSSARKIIRSEKESALAPHESHKANIDQALIELDRLIIHVERLD